MPRVTISSRRLTPRRRANSSSAASREPLDVLLLDLLGKVLQLMQLVGSNKAILPPRDKHREAPLLLGQDPLVDLKQQPGLDLAKARPVSLSA